MLGKVLMAAVAAAGVSLSGAQESGTCSGAGANPWVYNFEVNGWPAKIINDATTQIPVNPGPIGPPGAVIRALESRYMNTTSYTFDNNILYVERPDGGMLIDAGAGPNGESGLLAGTLLQTLMTEGIAPESIKNIFITHVHVDHHGGLVNNWDDFIPVYPEATIHVSKPEFDNILLEDVQFGDSGLDTEQRALMSLVGKGVFGAVADKIKTFEFGDQELIPGVRVMPSLWHNIGCATYVVEDGDSAIVVAALNHVVLSVENPHFIFEVDYNQSASVDGRYELLDMIIEKKWTLLPEHGFFPGLVQLVPIAQNYMTMPIQYKGSPDTIAVCLEKNETMTADMPPSAGTEGEVDEVTDGPALDSGSEPVQDPATADENAGDEDDDDEDDDGEGKEGKDDKGKDENGVAQTPIDVEQNSK